MATVNSHATEQQSENALPTIAVFTESTDYRRERMWYLPAAVPTTRGQVRHTKTIRPPTLPRQRVTQRRKSTSELVKKLPASTYVIAGNWATQLVVLRVGHRVRNIRVSPSPSHPLLTQVHNGTKRHFNLQGAVGLCCLVLPTEITTSLRSLIFLMVTEWCLNQSG